MNSPKLENLHQIEEILDLYNLPKLILNYQIKSNQIRKLSKPITPSEMDTNLPTTSTYQPTKETKARARWIQKRIL